MYVNGTKSPHSIKKIPHAENVNFMSLKMLRSGQTEDTLFDRGRRERMQSVAGTVSPRMMKPRIRVVHAKPTLGRSFCRKMGNMIPPIDPAVIATPVARPRFWSNQWAIDA